MLVGIIGCGSIGGTLAEGFHRIGHAVVVNDPPKADELDWAHRSKAEIGEHADIVVVAMPTPTTKTGGDWSLVDEALGELGDTDATVVLRSTMPPGSTGTLAERHGLPLVYSPEFLRDRSDVSDFFEPDRIVMAGPAPQREHALSALEHQKMQAGQVIETDDYLTAELGKYAHNAFFATKVSFANQMRAIAERGNADPGRVMDIVTADSRNTTSHLDPMLGPFGGKCLPKDLGALRYWAQQQDVPIPLLDGTKQMNELAKGKYEYVDIQGNWPNVTVASD